MAQCQSKVSITHWMNAGQTLHFMSHQNASLMTDSHVPFVGSCDIFIFNKFCYNALEQLCNPNTS